MKTLQPVFAMLGFVAATLATTGPAIAQQGCVPHETATDQLENRFNEQVVGRGLANSGKAMFELFVSEKGSWTVVVSQPNGPSCILASGESWQHVPLPIGDPS